MCITSWGTLPYLDNHMFKEHCALTDNLTPGASQTTEQVEQICSIYRSQWVSRQPFINPTKYILPKLSLLG